jgi:hypothetical protein
VHIRQYVLCLLYLSRPLKRVYQKLEEAANELGLYTNEAQTNIWVLQINKEDYIAISQKLEVKDLKK